MRFKYDDFFGLRYAEIYIKITSKKFLNSTSISCFDCYQQLGKTSSEIKCQERLFRLFSKKSEYESFRKTSEKPNKTIREAEREAIQKRTKEVSGISSDDPIFKLKSVLHKQEGS